jgi:hypothetical protein
MTDHENRSPEDWEASDIIDNLKATIPIPGRPLHPVSPDLCRFHTSALIWIVRHMDRRESRSLTVPSAVASAAAAVVIGIVEAVKFFMGRGQ